jgi:hypothetical protein
MAMMAMTTSNSMRVKASFGHSGEVLDAASFIAERMAGEVAVDEKILGGDWNKGAFHFFGDSLPWVGF